MVSFGYLLGPVVGAGLSWLSHDSLPKTDGAVHFPGLKRPVEIVRDRFGIPHITAENFHDLFFAQGYVHAQDRLWQMDFNRRLVAGRLSEVLGSAALQVDRWIRILGLRRVSEREPALLGPEHIEQLQAYADGINARIDQGHFPVEFLLLGYKPEPWTVVDSLSWSKMMAWTLSGNWESELLRAELIDRLGPEIAGELELEDLQPWPNAMALILHGEKVLKLSQSARTFMGPSISDGVGSNSWVIAGSRSRTGKPLLANDMHLPLTSPSIWYENHLHAGALDVTGITFPGVPLVIAGHNQRIAWGFTAGFADVQDLYVEHLKRTPDGRILYEVEEGEWREAEVRQEQICVRGSHTVFEETISTRHGPIVNPLIHNFEVQEPLALRWTSLEPDVSFKALFAMNLAANCTEFREALREWAGPVLNVVYADVDGNIGYSLPGRIPIRARGDGRVPVPGWDGRFEWVGTIPFDELPHHYNPPQGFIATANNRIADGSYPHYLGSDYAIEDRARRITELIMQRECMDVADLKDMQYDQVSPSARWVSHFLGQLQVDNPELARIVRLMREWDCRLAPDCAASAVHEVFMNRIIPLVLYDKLGSLTERYAGKGPTPLLAEGSMWGFRSWEWFERTLTLPDSPWFDLGQGENRDDVLRIALQETVEALKKSLGPDVDTWLWGRLHNLTFSHTLGSVKPLNQFFNRGPFPVGGDGTTINATFVSLANETGLGTIGPPFRFIADLSDLDHTLGMLAPGQSGQPGSPHYDDQIAAWFAGDYHTMLYTSEDVDAGAQDRLLLQPAD